MSDLPPRHFTRIADVDARFEDEPTDVPAAPSRYEDPPELKARLVSAIGGEVRDESLLPVEVRQFRGEANDRFARIEGDIAEIKADTASIKQMLAQLIQEQPRSARKRK